MANWSCWKTGENVLQFWGQEGNHHPPPVKKLSTLAVKCRFCSEKFSLDDCSLINSKLSRISFTSHYFSASSSLRLLFELSLLSRFVIFRGRAAGLVFAVSEPIIFTKTMLIPRSKRTIRHPKGLSYATVIMVITKENTRP